MRIVDKVVATLVVLLGAGTVLQAQFAIQNSGTAADLRGIDTVDGKVAWASGTNGTVLRTVDGGEHWLTCATPAGAEKLDFRGVQAFDAKTAIVMSSGKGDLSRLYKTTDGCATWALLLKNSDPDGFFDAFWLNAIYGEGMLLGDPVRGQFTVLKTVDGGVTWKRDQSKSLKLNGVSLAAFAASNSSIGRASRGEGDTRGPGIDFFPGFVTGGKGGPFLIERWEGRSRSKVRFSEGRSAGMFLTPGWNRRAIPLASGADSTGAFALALRYTGSPCSDCGFGTYWHLVVVGGDYTKPDERTGTAAASFTDGGWTWTAADTPPHGYRSAVAYDAGAKMWITVGPNGTDVSTDDGKNWSALKPDVARGEAADADRNWNALSLPFAVGPKGRIGKRTTKNREQGTGIREQDSREQGTFGGGGFGLLVVKVP